MEIGGYTGKILKVNLTTGEISKEPVSDDLIERFVGGEAGNFKLGYDLIKPGMEAFSEESPIIIGAGPLVGTPAPSSHRVFVLFKHPLYGGVIENAHGGGDFGPMLKWAGYDYIIITGKSEKPVYLNIYDDSVEIRDGSHIWGKDLYEATDILWETLDNPSVVAIGPAGERLIKTTVALMDKQGTLGKGGLPAVMGSKMLKAIAVKGTGGVKIVDPERLKKLVTVLIERIRSDPKHPKALELGSMAGWDGWFKTLGVSSKNWSSILPLEDAYRLYGVDIYNKNIKKDRLTDFGCPVGCKDRVCIKEGEFAGLETYGSSFYGRLSNFAGRCNVGSFNRMVKALDYSQRMGICVHEVTGLIDWAIDLYKHGIITKEDTGGLEYDWDFDTTMKLLEEVAEGKGFGAILGEGILSAIEKIGRGCEKLAIHVKGMIPLYDARVNRLSNAEFGQITYPRGAHPGRAPIGCTYVTKDLPAEVSREWAKRVGVPEEAIKRIFTPPGRFNIGRITKWAEEQKVISNTLGIGCSRSRVDNYYDIQTYSDAYEAVTGMAMTPGKLHLIADRAYTMLKVLNMREGFTRKDDRWPDRWFEPLVINGQKKYLEDYFGQRLTREDCERILDDYYDERGWDINLGTPTRKKLIEVGLEDIAKDLAGAGYFKPAK